MKQILLVGMIHLLILHQYRKDSTEALAPKKNSIEKIDDSYKYIQYKLMGIDVYTNDSLRLSYAPQYMLMPVLYRSVELADLRPLYR